MALDSKATGQSRDVPTGIAVVSRKELKTRNKRKGIRDKEAPMAGRGDGNSLR